LRTNPVRRRARRALTRQLLYQTQKAATVRGHEADNIAGMKRRAEYVRDLLANVRMIPPRARILEVGSGGRGLIFYFESDGIRIGVDPLALDFVNLFPVWQRRAAMCAASGDALPFESAAFDVVLCENVIDHAEKPAGIVAELSRVLKPNGLLYFSVNVHHPVYRLASSLHAAWNAAGIHLEIGPFADHTVHLTLDDARGMLRSLPLRIVMERDGIAEARAAARATPPRHPGDHLKRLFFKNARYEAVALRQP